MKSRHASLFNGNASAARWLGHRPLWCFELGFGAPALASKIVQDDLCLASIGVLATDDKRLLGRMRRAEDASAIDVLLGGCLPSAASLGGRLVDLDPQEERVVPCPLQLADKLGTTNPAGGIALDDEGAFGPGNLCQEVVGDSLRGFRVCCMGGDESGIDERRVECLGKLLAKERFAAPGEAYKDDCVWLGQTKRLHTYSIVP